MVDVPIVSPPPLVRLTDPRVVAAVVSKLALPAYRQGSRLAD